MSVILICPDGEQCGANIVADIEASGSYMRATQSEPAEYPTLTVLAPETCPECGTPITLTRADHDALVQQAIDERARYGDDR